MVGVNDHSHILQVALAVYFVEQEKVFIVIIREALSVFIYTSSKNRVGVGVALRLYFLLAVDKMVTALGGLDGVQHNCQVSAGWVFHSTGDGDAAGGEAVDIVNNLSDFIFSIIKALGVIILGWGIVQVGMSIQSHDASQRTQGFLCLFGGLMIAFAKEILTAIGAV